MHPATATTTCPRCGREDDGRALACAMCGELLRRAAIAPPVASETTRGPGAVVATSTPRFEPDERAQTREAWFFLALGLVLAPVFSFTPMLGFMGWFLASLVHEMGHSAMAWLCGMPSFPAISPAGHAAAVHGEQMLFLVGVIAAVVVQALVRRLEGRRRALALGVFLVGYGVLAFTPVREFAFLVAGHGGELAFAVLCLFKALDGGFTDSRAERAAYSLLGWFLLGKNLILFAGLGTSAASRAHYADNGSFGLTNDLIRVADDVLGWPLATVGWLAVPFALAVLPAAFWLWSQSRAARAAD
ncbi:MAG TPA: hypothetical protein VMT18_13710 [Planctomycetota bacterium]|nr:hypothetical protein [Planctomycetota bacterium]